MPDEVTNEAAGESMADLMQGLTAAIERWKDLNGEIKEAVTDVNTYRGKLNAMGVTFALDEFDQETGGLVTTTPMVPNLPDYQGLEDARMQEAASLLTQPAIEGGVIPPPVTEIDPATEDPKVLERLSQEVLAGVRPGGVGNDPRSPEQIHQEALEATSEMEAQSAARGAQIGRRYERALVVGFNTSEYLAGTREGARRGVSTRGY